MGSGSGHEDGSKAIVTGFLDDLVRALRAEKVKVRELTTRGSTDDGEHSWDKTIGYRCTFRGIAVALRSDTRGVSLDNTSLGDDILLSQMPGTHVSRYDLLKSDMVERHVMQEADREAERRTAAEKKKEKEKAPAYAGLAEKIRAKTPVVRRKPPNRKK